ncbi:hypothetical protein ACIQNU_43050 [Streptomyces sp. NPDC091292]|uniref:hypothetical protein n=1 Tax=Streptomyces sp. NPDC091292 TaxID=3365991 RepID=UPI003801C528
MRWSSVGPARLGGLTPASPQAASKSRPRARSRTIRFGIGDTPAKAWRSCPRRSKKPVPDDVAVSEKVDSALGNPIG